MPCRQAPALWPSWGREPCGSAHGGRRLGEARLPALGCIRAAAEHTWQTLLPWKAATVISEIKQPFINEAIKPATPGSAPRCRLLARGRGHYLQLSAGSSQEFFSAPFPCLLDHLCWPVQTEAWESGVATGSKPLWSSLPCPTPRPLTPHHLTHGHLCPAWHQIYNRPRSRCLPPLLQTHPQVSPSKASGVEASLLQRCIAVTSLLFLQQRDVPGSYFTRALQLQAAWLQPPHPPL